VIVAALPVNPVLVAVTITVAPAARAWNGASTIPLAGVMALPWRSLSADVPTHTVNPAADGGAALADAVGVTVTTSFAVCPAAFIAVTINPHTTTRIFVDIFPARVRTINRQRK
jgi:hypothetical protein